MGGLSKRHPQGYKLTQVASVANFILVQQSVTINAEK